MESSGVVDKFYGVPSGKLRRYFSLKNIVDIFKIFAGFFSAFFILLKNKPVFLFSKGGFVSVPPCYAARILNIPVYTHECDFSPGLATKLNSKVASKVLLTYEQTTSFFSDKKKLVVTGNPVRPAFYSASAEKGLDFLGLKGKVERPILVVIGGSLGAQQINELVLNNLDFLCKNFVVVHQTGMDNNVSGMINIADGLYKSYSFIYKEMPDVLAAADVVLSRAGANSLWECSVLGKPLVLVPLCGSGTRGDQVENARFFEKKGAACVLVGKEANSVNLRETLTKMADFSLRNEFSRASASLSAGSSPSKNIAQLLFSEVILE